MRRGSLPGAGFTLIEVLVALTIASVALMAALRAVGTLTQSSGDLRLRALAQWSAENRLAEIRILGTLDSAPVGRRAYDCPQGDVALRCEEEVFAMPMPLFRRVEISVYAPEVQGATNRLARLVGFATAIER